MTQPTFVPIAEADQVRPAMHLDVPGIWITDRPAELVGPTMRKGANIGTPGPDSGFALRLAHRFNDELQLGEGESAHDVLLGVALVAAQAGRPLRPGARASTTSDSPSTCGASSTTCRPTSRPRAGRCSPPFRTTTWPSAALVDSVPEETLRLSPDAVRAGGGPAA